MDMAVEEHKASLHDYPIRTQLDSSLDTLWVSLQPSSRRAHNFSLELLSALEDLLDQLEESRWHWRDGSCQTRLRYVVLTSEHPRYFSLGGDLAYFQSCIERGDADALRTYSMRCLDLVYRLFAASQELTTIALVRGRALGGGFETALSACHLVAERDADFGFPEITFGTFPCTGGLSLLANRIGLHRAAAFVRSARIYSAEDLHQQGVVDDLCDVGEGPVAVQRFIREHRRRYNARMAIQRAVLRMGALDITELRTVVEDWVNTAMNLSSAERRVLDALVRMQSAEALFESVGQVPALSPELVEAQSGARLMVRQTRRERRSQQFQQRPPHNERRSQGNERRSQQREERSPRKERRNLHNERRSQQQERRSQQHEKRSPRNERRNPHNERRSFAEMPSPGMEMQMHSTHPATDGGAV